MRHVKYEASCCQNIPYLLPILELLQEEIKINKKGLKGIKINGEMKCRLAGFFHVMWLCFFFKSSPSKALISDSSSADTAAWAVTPQRN